MTTPNTTNSDSKKPELPKSFDNRSISRDEYRAVRSLVTDASKAMLAEMPSKDLLAKRKELRAMLSVATPRVAEVNGAKTMIIPVLVFQYIPSGEQANKRWAYRKALNETIELCDKIMASRNNVVSPLLSAEKVQAEAQPVTPELAGVATEESPYATEPASGTDDLPL
jgi:hypothetical protein